MKLSAVMNVYNEELCLPYCLDSLLPVLDELILVDGSEDGPSSDSTQAIIDTLSAEYPDKIRYFSGTFRKPDGSWDAASQWNVGLQQITGDFVMCTAADIIYDYEDAVLARQIVELFPEKTYFYAPFLEFFVDTEHIIMQDAMTKEPALPRPLCGHAVWVASSLGIYSFDNTEYNKEAFATREGIDWKRDVIFMPHVKRFHFAYVKSFPFQVAKIVKYVLRGEHGPIGAEVRARGKEAIYNYAVDFAKGFANSPPRIPYTGMYPKVAEPLRSMTAMDGYEEFMEWYESTICLQGY